MIPRKSKPLAAGCHRAFPAIPGAGGSAGPTIALAGNPNAGKSTLFNRLVGGRQHVGNWPGKTVERAEGRLVVENNSFRVVDLPGTYSLFADTPEEVVARDFLLGGEAAVTVVTVDSTNLERHLYLARQTLLLTGRVVVALNKMDLADSMGIRIDCEDLAVRLGVPVVPVSAVTGSGIPRLLKVLGEAAEAWGEGVRNGRRGESSGLPSGRADRERMALELHRWSRDTAAAVSAGGARGMRGCSRDAGRDPEWEPSGGESSRTAGDFSARLDRVVTGRWFAFPLMAVLFGAVLWLTMFGAAPLSALLDRGFSAAAALAEAGLRSAGAPGWILGPLVDGMLVGVGKVISVMLPTMAIFFVLIALLEESGLVPRLAFNADRLFQAAGTQGKHCLSCLAGLGCNVPGVMSARIMKEPHRTIAVLTNSLVPCNGRLGVILPLSLVFFGSGGVGVVAGILLISAAAMLLGTLFLSRVVFRGVQPGFIMELPPYRWPDFRTVVLRTLRERVIQVLGRAVTVAAPVTILIWFMANYPAGAGFEGTAAGRLTAFLGPLGTPLGIPGHALTAVLFSLAAKEIVVGALAITGGLAASLRGSGADPASLLAGWSALEAFNFLLFFTLFMPCLLTAMTMFRETRSWRLTALGLALPFGLAYLFTLASYRIGLVLGL